MAKLGLGRVIDHPPHRTHRFSDARTSADWNGATLRLRVNGQAIIRVDYDSNAVAPLEYSVDLSPDTDSLTAARVNRLLDGMGWPRVEKYHRTRSMVVRTAGKPTDVPCVITIKRPTASAEWRVSSVAPGAPSATPTPTPPSITLPPAAPTPPVVPAPAPKVQRDPNAPVVVAKQPPRPSCGCPQDGCMFTYPGEQETHRIVVPDDTSRKVNAAMAKHKRGKSSTVAMVGPKGTGKTEYVWDVASQHGMPLFVFDGAAAATFADWVGGTSLVSDDKGNTVTRFLPSAFIEAIRQDGPHGDELRGVCIDEVNRAPGSDALNALMPILSAKSIYVAELGQTIRVSRNVVFFFTLNRGAVYNATVALDAALADRIQVWLKQDVLTHDAETDLINARTGLPKHRAARLVTAAGQVRDAAKRGDLDEGISTRRVLDAAELSMDGLTLLEAAQASWVNYYPDDGPADGEAGTVLTAINTILANE